MKHCPTHIEDSVVEARSKFAEVADDFHHFFQVVCNYCEGNSFHLFFGNKCSVQARCNACQRLILIYDLALYPAATRAQGEETFIEFEMTRHTSFPVYVGFEYGEVDNDCVFDQNDITWCQVFIERNGEFIKIFDDETA